MPPFWSAIRTSLPRFGVGRDVGSGTRDLGHDLSDLKTSGNFVSELSTFSWKCRKGALPLFVTTLMIQKTTWVFFVGSWTYVTGISLVAILSTLFLWSAAGVDRKKNRILTFVKIRKKTAFYPNRKIFSQKLIRWNVELDERKKSFDVMGTLSLWSCCCSLLLQ